MQQIRRPVSILTGFLGAGKTTVLNRLLKLPAFSNTLVIVNEFGETPLDHLLVENSSDTVLELSNGCVCCAVRGELVDTLIDVEEKQFARIIIETTGIANPLPILQSIAGHPVLSERYVCGQTITLFDVLRGLELVEAHEEAKAQIALADCIILNKINLLDTGNRDATIASATPALSDINPAATILSEHDLSAINPEILGTGFQIGSRISNRNTQHAGQYRSTTLEFEGAITANILLPFVEALSNKFPQGLLRLKGLVHMAEHPDQPLVLQMSGKILHNPDRLPSWPDKKPVTRLVAITKNIAPIEIEKLFNSHFGVSATDTPDREAILDNPLSVPGMKF